MLPVPRGVLWWYICRVACKGPKAGSVRKTKTGTVPRRAIRRSPLAQQLPDLWWRRQQPKASEPWKARLKGGGLACGVPAYLYRDPATLWWCVPGGTGRPYGSPFFFLIYAAALWGDDASNNHAASNV